VVITFFFLFGIVLGSFLNVCITRIPEGLSIVRPGSRCPRCGTPIKPYDNVPILGWILLRGKCRSCGLPISPMYPLVELLTGLLFVACYLSFGLGPATFKWMVFSCLIVVLTITDLRVRMLPDVVNWPGFAAGLIFAAFVPLNDGTTLSLAGSFGLLPPPQAVLSVLDALLGAAFGSFLLWGFAAMYKLVRGHEGMGMGDVKMMAMAGAFLGLRWTFLTILVGTLLGSIIGIAVILGLYAGGWRKQVAERASKRGLGSVSALRWAIARQYQLPLGTFLGIAALLIVFLIPLAIRALSFLPII
jgi:leader peptidase (prepilin peptidase)/N-methyltransferase